MKINIKGTRVLDETLLANTRYIINQGGTRSSKTYSICQYILIYCLNNTGKTISIVRKTLPALKATALRDFKDVFSSVGLWSDDNFNKTELHYKHNGNLIEFISADTAQKLRGRRRDLLWCNEANELNHEDFRQLSVRTSGTILIDINPSDQFSWIYELAENEETKNDCTLIKSTYRDNPFISENEIKAIESNKDDAEWYKVFGLGERSLSKELIYTRWRIETFPTEIDFIYGLDFGYNHPMALTKVAKREKEIFCKEEVHQSYLTMPELIQIMNDKGILKQKTMYCDSARPEYITELVRAGYNATKSNKEVKPGIDYVKSHTMVIDPKSNNLKREANSYKWKIHSNGMVLDEPVKLLDDGMDSIRYAAYTSKSNGVFNYMVG